MALKVLNTAGPALGQFDAVDAELASFAGGEVCRLVGVSYRNATAIDLAAADSFNDGYTGTATKTRPAVSKLNMTGTGDGRLCLSDDGIAGYGTMFGTIIGLTVGQNTTGTVIGPSSASGSGKITLHFAPGLYGVTLDVLDASLQPNATLAVGQSLFYTASGALCASTVSHAGTTSVGTFVEFQSNGSLVTTPSSLVAALNSPSGSIGSTAANKLQAIIHWQGGQN